VISSFAATDPPVTVTAEQMTLEDLGDSRVRVTIVQAEGGPTVEDITAAAEQPAFLTRIAVELEVAEVSFDLPPATIAVIVAPPPPSPTPPPSGPTPGAVPNGRTTDEDKFPVVPVVGGGVGAAFLVAAALIARSALADRRRARIAQAREAAANARSPSVRCSDADLSLRA